MDSIRWIVICLVVWTVEAAPSARDVASGSLELRLKIARDVLDRVPLIDGHNDFPMTLRMYEKNQVANVDIYDLTNTTGWSDSPLSHTDIRRLRQGKVGAQFWSAYVGCNTQYKDAVVKTTEQIDVVHRMVAANPEVFEFVTTAQGIEDAFARGKIGSLIGVEGGHSIGSSLAILRTMYDQGVRYLTLTHSCTTPWADNSQLDNPGNSPVHGGLSKFGEAVVMEMNRLGMLIDLSHVSRNTMRTAIRLSRAPVIFSHSGAFALCNNTRNVPDDVLNTLSNNGGVVMAVFYPGFVTCGGPATLKDVADHIDYLKRRAGVDNVGIGGDFNGVESLPQGLEDVSKYPDLFAELLLRGWTEGELEKLAGLNVLRVLRQAEQVSQAMAAEGVKPFDQWIPDADLGDRNCITAGRQVSDTAE